VLADVVRVAFDGVVFVFDVEAVEPLHGVSEFVREQRELPVAVEEHHARREPHS